MLQLYRRTKSGTVNSGLAKFDENKVIASIKYVIGGIVSNLAEARLSRECPEEKNVAPTLFSFFGLVNIQPRGEAIKHGDLINCPFRTLVSRTDIHVEFKDFDQPEQFARFGDKILLIDAGTPVVARYLARQHKRGYPLYGQVALR